MTKTSRCGGFTLVEVLTAVLLLSVGLMAIISAISAGREAQRRAANIAIGRNVAQSYVEDIRSQSVDTATGSQGETTTTSLPEGNRVIVEVSPYPDESETNLYRAKVTVSWPEGNGVRTVCYETLTARRQ